MRYMANTFRISENTVSHIKYNFVFCPRYRRKIFNEPGIKERFRAIAKDVLSENLIVLYNLDFGADYVELSVDALPDKSPADVMRIIKKSTGQILKEFPSLEKVPNLWTRNYLVSTENISEESLIRFLAEQRKE